MFIYVKELAVLSVSEKEDDERSLLEELLEFEQISSLETSRRKRLEVLFLSGRAFSFMFLLGQVSDKARATKGRGVISQLSRLEYFGTRSEVLYSVLSEEGPLSENGEDSEVTDEKLNREES